MKKLLVLARRNTDAGLTPDAARNLSPRVNCQCRLTYGVHTAHMYNCTHHLYMRMLNIPNHTHTIYVAVHTCCIKSTHTHHRVSVTYVFMCSPFPVLLGKLQGQQVSRHRGEGHRDILVH